MHLLPSLSLVLTTLLLSLSPSSHALPTSSSSSSSSSNTTTTSNSSLSSFLSNTSASFPNTTELAPSLFNISNLRGGGGRGGGGGSRGGGSSSPPPYSGRGSPPPYSRVNPRPSTGTIAAGGLAGGALAYGAFRYPLFFYPGLYPYGYYHNYGSCRCSPDPYNSTTRAMASNSSQLPDASTAPSNISASTACGGQGESTNATECVAAGGSCFCDRNDQVQEGENAGSRRIGEAGEKALVLAVVMGAFGMLV